MYIRWTYVALLGAVLLLGLLSMTSGSSFSLRDLAAGSASVFTFLAIFQLILICVLTPIFMSGAIAKESDPKTWDILLTTPISPLQIVLGNIFGRLFLILALLIGALPIMIVTQFFGGVPLRTILLTQVVTILLAFVVASAAIGMSVTRTAGRKAAVSFFILTVLYILVTYTIDQLIRVPITAGASATWTTLLTPLNPFLVLEALLQPSGYIVPETSNLPWPLGWITTHPVAGWAWITIVLSISIITWASLQVRKLGNKSDTNTFWQKFTQSTLEDREPRAVSGNPIAWRERVTRHRNIGSNLGRWGFVFLFGLAFILLTTFLYTKTISADIYRDIMLYLVIGEVLIVGFSAITISASSIAKEREDGSLDLLLTTSITPKLYLGGKIRGLIMHLLPIVLVPCVSMLLIGLLVLANPDGNAVSDTLARTVSGDQAAQFIEIPIALFGPAILFPAVFIPFVAFCMTLGLLWSMKSKSSIGAIVASLIFVFILVAGLGMCAIPVSNVPYMGAAISALSPIANIFTVLSPATAVPTIAETGVYEANLATSIGTIVACMFWSLLSWGLLKSMTVSFVPTVRRLAGIQ
jgi:ABC-type transport system involved in multi-copper enzyme maturation permease subunit